MCIFSACGQILYGILMFGCIVLTCVGLFTDSWSTKDIANIDFNQGLMPWTCFKSFKQTDYCDNWWNNQPGWLKCTVICMCLALFVEVIAFIWNVVTFFACCCKKYIIHPLSILTLLIVILMAIAVIVYGVNNKGEVNNLNINFNLGYSFWIAVCALALAVADLIVAVVTICLGEANL